MKNKKYTNPKLLSAVVTGLAIIFIITSTVIATYAQGAETPTEVTTNADCIKEIKPFMKTKSDEFRTYLSSHLQNKSTNSSLLDLALKRFQLYKQELYDKLNSFPIVAGTDLLGEASGAFTCKALVDDEIALMEELFRKFFIETSNLKTTSSLMTKLKNINAKLDALNGRVIQMYGKYETFEGRVSCYASKCL